MRSLLTTVVAVVLATLAYGAEAPADVDSPKAGCFVKSYLGLKTKVPPYVPFELQMAMR